LQLCPKRFVFGSTGGSFLGQKTGFGSNEKGAFWLPTVLERFYTKHGAKI
jgi:hypothetical protein